MIERPAIVFSPDAPAAGGGNLKPLPTTLDEAWENFADVMLRVSNIPDANFLFPVDQDLQEELGLSSLQMNDGRETLGSLHGITITPEPDRTKWPRTVADMFTKYVNHTPAAAELQANPAHEIFSRQG